MKDQVKMIFTKIAVMDATMAGVPNPWLIMEKCVKCLCTAGSMMGCGLVLHRGDLSWFRKSTSSLQINLTNITISFSSENGILTNLAASRRSLHLQISVCCLLRYSATGLAGNSVSQT